MTHAYTRKDMSTIIGEAVQYLGLLRDVDDPESDFFREPEVERFSLRVYEVRSAIDHAIVEAGLSGYIRKQADRNGYEPHELPNSLENLRKSLIRSYEPDGTVWWTVVRDAFVGAKREAKNMPLPELEPTSA